LIFDLIDIHVDEEIDIVLGRGALLPSFTLIVMLEVEEKEVCTYYLTLLYSTLCVNIQFFGGQLLHCKQS
jgi:hypothetical protein